MGRSGVGGFGGTLTSPSSSEIKLVILSSSSPVSGSFTSSNFHPAPESASNLRRKSSVSWKDSESESESESAGVLSRAGFDSDELGSESI